MFASLHRHPFSIKAFFRYSLVLTYAFPEAILRPLLPEGLSLDTYGDNAFLCIALVQTERLRPVGVPSFLGKHFFLSGYRIFTRFQLRGGKELRGLLILRSDADSSLMVLGGNLLTSYHFRKCTVKTGRTRDLLRIEVQTPNAEADLSVCAEVATDAMLPDGSPFPDLNIARRYAGPLPFTFHYDGAARSMVIVKGSRENWKPVAVNVEVALCTFLERPPFSTAHPRLASAFLVENIPYQWKRGVVVPVQS